jgi:hypothetical protein
MKKYFILILILLISCQKEEIDIEEPTIQYTSIFESESIVEDGQDIFFGVNTEEEHQLVISFNTSTLTKETFTSTVGINKRKIFTKTLGKGKYKLVLLKGSEEISSTFILVE